MAARRALPRNGADQSSVAYDSTEQLRRISNLLALLAIKGESQEEKILTLSAAGFSSGEVADLLRTTSNTVAVTKSKSKKKPKKKSARKGAKSR